MPTTLEYFEKTIERWTQKLIDELRQQPWTEIPIYKSYIKQHNKDTKKGLVRLIDGTILKLPF